MKICNKRKGIKEENSNGGSIILLIGIVLLVIYLLFCGVTTMFKQYKHKIVDVVKEVCPKCDGMIKFIGGNEYDVKLNIEKETEIVRIKIGNGKDLNFEKIKINADDNKFYELENVGNRNSGLFYLYDINLNMFIYNGNKYNYDDFMKLLNSLNKFDFEFSSGEEEVWTIDNLDICFEDMIIDLGSKKISRTYNIKLKNYIYIITIEDYVNVIDSNITPVGYYNDELLSDNKIIIYDAKNGNINLKEELLDKIKYLDLDNTLKTPKFEINEVSELDLIKDDYMFNWFNENLTDDYSATLVVTYYDLLGNEYVELVGLIFGDNYEPIYKGLNWVYEYQVGEYERQMPIQAYVITNGEKVDVLNDIVVDDSNVKVNEVGIYEVYYKYKSMYSNIVHERVIEINVVE